MKVLVIFAHPDVGSGFGGSVTASRLIDEGVDVIMLERGPWRNNVSLSPRFRLGY